MTEAIFAVTPSETIKWVFFHFDSKAYIHWSFVYSEPNSSTMRNDRTRNIRALSTGRLPLSDRKVFLAFTEVFSQWYVNANQVQHFIHINIFSLFTSAPFLFQMMRQGANSAVRFTTYVTLKQFVQGTARPGQPLPSAITFGIGGIAGLVTVYTTMPLE